jgi:hypothetical protein
MLILKPPERPAIGIATEHVTETFTFLYRQLNLQKGTIALNLNNSAGKALLGPSSHVTDNLSSCTVEGSKERTKLVVLLTYGRTADGTKTARVTL